VFALEEGGFALVTGVFVLEMDVFALKRHTGLRLTDVLALGMGAFA